MKALLSNCLVFILTVTIGLGCAEILLRIKNHDQRNYNIEMWRYSKELKTSSPDPILGHEHRPNRRAKLQGVEIRLNHLGMRGPEIDLSDHTRKRILFLGSSNTLGWGVPEEETMTAILQRELAEEAQIFNAGIGNYNAERYVHLFEVKFLALKPDLVVVHYFINDAEILEPGGGNFLLRHSQLAVALYHLLYQMRHLKSDVSSLASYYRKIYQKNHPGRQGMEAAFAKLYNLSKENGFRVVLAVTPDIHAISPYPFNFAHEEMKKIAVAYEWDYVDLLEAMSSVPAKDLWAMPGDPHMNRLGHALMAKALLPHLK